MGYKIDGIWYCDHCGQVSTECQKQSKIIGTCKNYNALVYDKNSAKYGVNTRVKPLGLTDDEAMAQGGINGFP